jgi:hypothetical protein
MDVGETVEFVEVDQSVSEAAAWCSNKAPFRDLRDCLRTPELQPQLAQFPRATELEALNTAVLFVAGQRRKLLITVPNAKPPGQLLICEFNASISSGESERATNGFFDVDDRPPWDTWIFALRATLAGEANQAILVSWVPESLRVVVNAGIEANPYGCIYWARTAQPDIKQHALVERLLQTAC